MAVQLYIAELADQAPIRPMKLRKLLSMMPKKNVDLMLVLILSGKLADNLDVGTKARFMPRPIFFAYKSQKKWTN